MTVVYISQKNYSDKQELELGVLTKQLPVGRNMTVQNLKCRWALR